MTNVSNIFFLSNYLDWQKNKKTTTSILGTQRESYLWGEKKKHSFRLEIYKKKKTQNKNQQGETCIGYDDEIEENL